MITVFGLLFLTGVSALSCALYRHLALRWNIVDEQNHRTFHDGIVPRGGGIVFIALGLLVLMFGSIWWPPEQPLIWSAALLGGWIIWGVGLIDDIRDLGVRLRITAHATTMILVMLPCLTHPSIAGIPTVWILALFALGLIGGIWTINLYNFMDGIDGIAATQGIVILAACGISAWFLGLPLWPLICAVLAALLAGFLFLNKPKALLFMGDAGSGALGYMVAVLIGFGALENLALGAAAFISVASFSLDATLTLTRRALAGEDLSEPHRSHIYQRLAQYLGSHARLLGVWHIWSAICLLPLSIASAASLMHPITAVLLAYGLTTTLWGVLYWALPQPPKKP